MVAYEAACNSIHGYKQSKLYNNQGYVASRLAM